MSTKVVELDVREDIRAGREPFSRIMQTVASLKDDQGFVLIAPFEPAPLFGLLAQRGFTHTSEPLPGGDWKVHFTRGAGGATAGRARGPQAAASRPPREAVGLETVDARGLEAPGPLVKILEAVAALPPGGRFRAHTDRRPMHLYAQLEQRGCRGTSEEQADGSFITVIERAAD